MAWDERGQVTKVVCIIALCYRVYFLRFCINYDKLFSKYLIELIVAWSLTSATKIIIHLGKYNVEVFNNAI